MSEFPECTSSDRIADLIRIAEGVCSEKGDYRSVVVFATYACDKHGDQQSSKHGGFHVSSAAQIGLPIDLKDARCMINRMREVTNELERKLLPDEAREIIIPWPPESLG